MYAFIFYGTYKTLKYTVLSKGKEKQEDRLISAVGMTSFIMGLHIYTVLGILLNRFGFEIPIVFDKSHGKLFVIILYLLLYLINHLFYAKKLKTLSEKYHPIYEKHKNLDKIVGFGILPLSVVIFWILGTP